MGRREVEGNEEEKRICHSMRHPICWSKGFAFFPLLPEGICEPSQY